MSIENIGRWPALKDTDSFAEALLIAMTMCRDSNGFLVKLNFSFTGDFRDEVFIARQIAEKLMGAYPQLKGCNDEH